MSRVGGVVRVMRMAVVQEERRVRLRGVHALHGGVHVVHQLLQVHVIICGGGRMGERWEKVSDSESRVQSGRSLLLVTSGGLGDYFIIHILSTNLPH